MKRFIKPIYRGIHDFLFNTIDYNPFFPKAFNDGPIQKGHISEEHLLDETLDIQLAQDIKEAGIKTKSFEIDIKEYQSYLQHTPYSVGYYGGGKDNKQNFTEKSLEHYVSTKFIDFNSETTFIDIAACSSPFHKIVKEKYGIKNSYQQDLIFSKGLHGSKIGGYASEIPLPDNSVDAVTLHCSLEHFENNSDTEFFIEMERVLKKGGRIVILPFYLAYEYTIHTDPVYNWLKFHSVEINDPRVKLRYANWYQFFSRHYDVKALKDRILNKTTNLELSVFRVTNFKAVHPSCYLRFIGVFEKT